MHMIVVASSRPMITAQKAFFLSTFSRQAMSEPVQAPVPGSGMPTKSTSPQNSAFLIFSLFPIDRASIFSTSGRKSFVVFSQLKIGVMKSRMKGTGMMLPMRQNRMPSQSGMPRSAAAMRPPRSSMSGTMETIPTISQFGIPVRTCMNQFNSFSPI